MMKAKKRVDTATAAMLEPAAELLLAAVWKVA